MADQDYTPSAGIDSPNVQEPNIDTGYEQAKSNISSFVDTLQNIGTRYMENEAKNDAPQDVENNNGVFKPLPDLSSTAQAYNSAGQEFEQNTARMTLQAAGQGLRTNLLYQKMQANQPLGPDDINNFKSAFADVAQSTISQLSPASQPYVTNMAKLQANQDTLELQNKMEAQNKSVMQYGALTNVSNLNDAMSNALKQGDPNAALNYALQSRQYVNNPSFASLVGGKTAANTSKNNDRVMAGNIGAALASTDMSQDQARQQMNLFATQLSLSPEDAQHMNMAYNSGLSQKAIAQGITASTVGASVKNYEDYVAKGNKPSDTDLMALNTQVNSLPGAEGSLYSAKISAIQQASQNIQALKYAPLSTIQSEIRQLASNANISTDHTYIMAATLTSKGLSSVIDSMNKDPANYVMGSPYFKQLMQQNQQNLATQAATGHQLQTSNLSIDPHQFILEAEKHYNLPLSVLSIQQAKDAVVNVTRSGTFSQGVQALQNYLSPYQSSGTDAYAKNDLLKNGLPESYIIALNLPKNSAELDDFAEAMRPDYRPGTTALVNEDNWKLIQQGVQIKTSDFATATANIDAPNSGKMGQAMINASSRLAASFVDKGMSIDDATQKATDEVINNNYNIRNNLFIPKGYDPDQVTEALDNQKQVFMGTLGQKSYLQSMLNNKLHFNTSDESNKARTIASIANAHWVMNAASTGYVLARPGGIVITDDKGNPYSYNLLDHPRSPNVSK